MKLNLDQTVPAGTLLVAAIAARGQTPTTVIDKKDNLWVRDVEVNNSSNTTVVAIFHSTLTTALNNGNEITASVTTANGQLRKLAVFRLDGLTMHDQSGSAMTTGTSAVVTTSGPVASPTQLMIGVVATGFNTADSYIPSAGFTEVHEFGSSFSSGCFDTKLTKTASGVQTMSVGTSFETANYAVVLSTYR